MCFGVPYCCSQGSVILLDNPQTAPSCTTGAHTREQQWKIVLMLYMVWHSLGDIPDMSPWWTADFSREQVSSAYMYMCLCTSQKRVVYYYHLLLFLSCTGCYVGNRSGCLTILAALGKVNSTSTRPHTTLHQNCYKIICNVKSWDVSSNHNITIMFSKICTSLSLTGQRIA